MGREGKEGRNWPKQHDGFAARATSKIWGEGADGQLGKLFDHKLAEIHGDSG